VISENFPLTAVSMFAASGPHYSHALAQVVSRANSVYSSFMKSEEGHGFCGQVVAMCCVVVSSRLLATLIDLFVFICAYFVCFCFILHSCCIIVSMVGWT